jgi:hypothetical protein
LLGVRRSASAPDHAARRVRPITSSTVVITGTSSGFGQLAVARFARAGWNVVATVRKESDLHVHDECPKVTTLLLDVDNEEADLVFGELARAQYGHVDAVINNAGYFQGGPLEASTMDQVHRQFQTNVFGLIALNKAFMPIFRQQRSGVIVKALHPGNHQTKILSKVDRAENVPSDCQATWNTFASLNLVRSDPAGTAEVMFAMVTDGNRKKVHYYSGPDGEAIPRVKQLLGQDWYFEELSARNRGQASALWDAVMPSPITATLK